MRVGTFVALAFVLAANSATIQSQTTPLVDAIGQVEVVQSIDSALATIFPNADSAVAFIVQVDSTMKSALRSRLGWFVADSAFDVFEIYAEGRRAGTAVVAEEQGKYRPITFMAGVDTTNYITDVRVLIYRESHGGEVRHSRFLKQYRGKSLADPLRVNRDIINITGATISVNSLNAGVRKVLALVEYMHPIGGSK